MNQDTREQPIRIERLPGLRYFDPVDGERPVSAKPESLKDEHLSGERCLGPCHTLFMAGRLVERAVHDRGAEEIASQDALDASMPDDDGLFAVHDRGADPLREALEAIRPLSDAATPGPWTHRPNHNPYRIVVFGGKRAYEAGYTTSDINADDAALIVAAVNFLRAALGEEPQRLDEAWAAAEAALPEDWRLELSAHRDGNPEAFYTASASYAYSLRHYRLNVGKARWAPFEMTHGPTPAVALHKLAAALAGRTE